MKQQQSREVLRQQLNHGVSCCCHGKAVLSVPARVGDTCESSNSIIQLESAAPYSTPSAS
jgi:hypothetical protein